MGVAPTIEENYVSISLDVVKRFKSPLFFDIYVQRTKTSYTKVFKKGDHVDWDRVEIYISKGLKSFFVTSDDYSFYANYVETLGKRLAQGDPRFNEKDALDILKEMVGFTGHEIQKTANISPRAVSTATNVVSSCIDMMEKDKKTMFKLIALLAKHPYMAKHSMMTAIFTIILAKELDFRSESKLKTIALGAFFHDIGTTQLNFNPEDIDVINAAQRKEINRHPQLGKQIVDQLSGLPAEVGLIVLQHHEQPNGAGYPNNLKSAEIYPPAKIVAIADCFCSLICKRSFREAFKIEEAFKKLSEDEFKFEKQYLRAFAKVFGLKLG